MNPISNAIPSRADLADADPAGFVLQVAPEQGIRVTLVDVREGVAMNDRFECYSLMIALPRGVAMVQEVYRLFGPDGRHWDLLMTPLLPDPDGRHILEAVVHREISATA
ncbi:DUF6916 family protein [Pseudomonas putida]|uniref:DUF6916 family protein n=1 Tax=Pseudomonas putida TaxID=303 RepID=UPI00300E90F3